jgi:hypothetical protein
LLAIAAATWLLVTTRSTSSLRVELDLRPYGIMRGESGETRRLPSLARDRVALTLLLPVSAGAGTYDVQVLDSELQSRISAQGGAEVENDVTTLQTTVDLTSLAPGAYQLAIRRTGQEWQWFPVRVQ